MKTYLLILFAVSWAMLLASGLFESARVRIAVTAAAGAVWGHAMATLAFDLP